MSALQEVRRPGSGSSALLRVSRSAERPRCRVQLRRPQGRGRFDLSRYSSSLKTDRLLAHPDRRCHW